MTPHMTSYVEYLI